MNTEDEREWINNKRQNLKEMETLCVFFFPYFDIETSEKTRQMVINFPLYLHNFSNEITRPDICVT